MCLLRASYARWRARAHVRCVRARARVVCAGRMRMCARREGTGEMHAWSGGQRATRGTLVVIVASSSLSLSSRVPLQQQLSRSCHCCCHCAAPAAVLASTTAAVSSSLLQERAVQETSGRRASVVSVERPYAQKARNGHSMCSFRTFCAWKGARGW
jgi:hypothetical protein